jgi:hypothetical protein
MEEASVQQEFKVVLEQHAESFKEIESQDIILFKRIYLKKS